MNGRPAALVALAALTLGGCAMRSDVNRVELQIAQDRVERSRADSARAADLAAIARMVQSLYDTLAAQSDMLISLRGDTRVELFNIEQQLVAIQELTGQSQQRLTELRGQMDERFEALLNAPQNPPAQAAPGQPAPAAAGQTPAAAGQTAPPVSSGQPPTAPGARPSPEPSAEQLLDLSLTQLRRGSPETARVGLAELLRRYPNDAHAADAQFFMGEAWAADHNTDSAAAAYQRVVQQHPNAPHAATAMYKLGLIASQAGQADSARTWFNRVVTQFPNSEEAALARDQLRSQPPPAPSHPAEPAAHPRPASRP